MTCKFQWIDKARVTDWKYWSPDSFIKNASPGTVEDVTYQVLFDSRGSALVEEIRNVRGQFSEKFELYDYPFDKQVNKMSWRFSILVIVQ